MTSYPIKIVHFTSSYKRRNAMKTCAHWLHPLPLLLRQFISSFLRLLFHSLLSLASLLFPFIPLHISPLGQFPHPKTFPHSFCPQPLQKMPLPLCSSKGMLFLSILATILLGNVPKTVWAQLLGGISQQRSSSIFERVKPEPSCSPLNIPLCREIPYNRTIFPNPFVELDWPSLQSQTEHFKPLIRTRCSPHILFFVCSTFAPMCPEQMPQAVTSCRSVCEEVQRDCIKIFHEFDFPWPPLFNCSRFPSPPALCMQPEPIPPNADGNGLSPSPKMPECPPDLVDLDPNDAAAKCAFRCDKTTMFRKDRKDQARLWLSCWALLNAGVSLFTVCSFWIDKTRFGFPERSVCFLALCSLLSSLPHLLGRLLGFEQIACAKLASGAKFLILDGPHENSACMATFLLHYYFSLAGALWWLLLGFTWYLSASRKWVEEEIGKRSILLHILAWTLPAGMAAGVLFGPNRVDASELTGICSIGNSDPESLLWFWLLPRFVLTILGLLLLLAGFSAMCKERNSFRRRGTDTSRLEKFLLKMGSFAAIYVLSTLVACFADFHHFSVLTQWEPNTVGCKARGGTFSGQCIRPEQPEPEIYVLGQTLAIAGGLATGLWIFSPKTLISWRRALFCCWPAQPKRPPITLGMMGGGIASSPALHPSSVHNSRPGSIPPSQRPLLAASLPPADLPPPPPTAVPSSTYATQHPFLPAPQYIPLSILTGAQGGSSTTRSGGPNLGGGILEHNLFHGC